MRCSGWLARSQGRNGDKVMDGENNNAAPLHSFSPTQFASYYPGIYSASLACLFISLGAPSTRLKTVVDRMPERAKRRKKGIKAGCWRPIARNIVCSGWPGFGIYCILLPQTRWPWLCLFPFFSKAGKNKRWEPERSMADKEIPPDKLVLCPGLGNDNKLSLRSRSRNRVENRP